jgi:hypothetical protein
MQSGTYRGTGAGRSTAFQLIVAAMLAAPTTAHAGSGTISTDGELHLIVNPKFVPQQQDLDQLKEQMERAQLMLCDATDRQVKLTRVTVKPSELDQLEADVWWFPNRGRPTAGGLAVLGRADSRIEVFQRGFASTMRADVIVHELGHHLLGLHESYDEQWRRGGCGIGRGFEPEQINETWNSIMQSPLQVCRFVAGYSHGEAMPLEWSDQVCRNDADCLSFGADWSCPLSPRGSEMSVPENHDLIVGTWQTGRGASSCPPALPARAVVVSAKWNPNAAARDLGELDLSTFGQAKDSSNAFVELTALDAVGRVSGAGHNFSGPSIHRLFLYAFKFDTDRFLLDVVVDQREYAGSGGTSAPKHIARFVLGFEAASGALASINGIPVNAQGQLLDGTGRFPPVRLGGDPAVFESIGSVTLPNGEIASGQVIGTGAFVAMDDGTVAPALDLDLDLADVAHVAFLTESGSPANSMFFTGGPHRPGSRILSNNGAWQRGLCGDEAWCAMLWNEETQLFEGTAHSTLSLDQGSLAATVQYLESSDPVTGLPRRPLSDWEIAQQNVPFLLVPQGLPSPEPPPIEACGPPGCVGQDCVVQVDFQDVNAPDHFLMVLDRSGSMMARETDTGDTRFEFVQSAARLMVEAFSGSPTRVGLISFNEAPSMDVPLTAIGTGAGQMPASTFKGMIDGLVPGGFTGIGTALNLAGTTLASQSGSRSILLLSDGENNQPCECLEPDQFPHYVCTSWCSAPRPRVRGRPAHPRAATRHGGGTGLHGPGGASGGSARLRRDCSRDTRPHVRRAASRSTAPAFHGGLRRVSERSARPATPRFLRS